MENDEAAKALCPDCGCGGCLDELILKEKKKADIEPRKKADTEKS